MMNSKKWVIKPGVKDLTIFVLIWLKIKMKVNIVIPIEAKTLFLNVCAKENVFDYHNCCFQLKIEKFGKKLEEVVSLENQVKFVRLQDELGKQNF